MSAARNLAVLRPLLGLDARKNWQSKGKAGMDAKRMFELSSSSDEYKAIQSEFFSTMQHVEIDTIHRIENGSQHELYSVHRRNVERDVEQSSLPSNRLTLVQLLFHGTSEDAISNIINSDTAGFLPLLAGSVTGAIWGDGTYFARDASYSHDYAARLSSGQRQMLVVEVVVGRWTTGRAGLKECPLIPGEKYRRFNSLSNREDDPSIFVIQHTSQAYPAYVITYH